MDGMPLIELWMAGGGQDISETSWYIREIYANSWNISENSRFYVSAFEQPEATLERLRDAIVKQPRPSSMARFRLLYHLACATVVQ